MCSPGRPVGQPLSAWPSGCLAWQKVLILELHEAFQPVSFIPGMLVGTIDLYNFISLSVTLTLAGVQHKAKLLAFIF